jgi:CheY-like chemotaxis protein
MDWRRFPQSERQSMNVSCRAIILIVDADPLTLASSEAVLSSAEYEVHCAATREEAVLAARRLELDLILCDIDVAGVEGYAIVDEIRRIPNRGDVPAMYSSACQQTAIIRKSCSDGGAYHLRKPFDPQVLLELTEKSLWLPHLVRTHIHLPHFQPHVSVIQTQTSA